ncbi:hypothetical protein RYX36_025674 [Vicia faba]
MDGSEKLQLWKEDVGGKSRGRCNGIARMVVNIQYGVSYLAQVTISNSNREAESQAIEMARAKVSRAREEAALANALEDEANRNARETMAETTKLKRNFLQSSELKLENRREEKHAYFDFFKEKKLSRPPNPDELFMVTHKKKNGQWVDRRAENTHPPKMIIMWMGQKSYNYGKKLSAVCHEADAMELPECVHPSASDHYDDDSDGQSLDL